MTTRRDANAMGRQDGAIFLDLNGSMRISYGFVLLLKANFLASIFEILIV